MSFRICTWNIQGLNSALFGLKSQNPEFIKAIKDIDIIILQETWYRGGEITGCPPGYREIIVPSIKLKSTKQGRDSGGLLIWSRADINCELIRKGNYNVWLKIGKNIIATPKDLFLCTIYIPPSESPYYDENTYIELGNEISYYQSIGHVMICGDLNARTGEGLDTVNTLGDKFIIGQNIHFPTHLTRNNYDKIINTHGRALLELCQCQGLYIVNGRLRGDSLGQYTYSSVLGCSTVDYFITDLHENHLRAFTVNPLAPFSDHSQITFYLNRTNGKPKFSQSSIMHRMSNTYRWRENSKDQYVKTIRQDDTKAPSRRPAAPAWNSNTIVSYMDIVDSPQRLNVLVGSHSQQAAVGTGSGQQTAVSRQQDIAFSPTPPPQSRRSLPLIRATITTPANQHGSQMIAHQG
ncbi:uncharacterized protein LOC121714729 [Alosa sapidissima]|uniref:uncharacterized protein LOC121714729 n=1 Tax=Alosa sapidissima TaxID=34773 RepID=UPI001C09B2E9|nr:uncharacterized protein LOC121714729 [Alosa sapidissima]